MRRRQPAVHGIKACLGAESDDPDEQDCQKKFFPAGERRGVQKAAEKEGRIYIDLHEEPSAELVLTDAELTAYVTQQNEIARLKEQIKGIEEALKSLDNRVKDYMIANGLEKLEGGGGVFTLKKAYERTTIDAAKLKKIQPGAYDMCKKTTKVSASLSFKSNE